MADTNISPSAADLSLSRFRPLHIVTGHINAVSGVCRSGCSYSGDTTADVSWFEDATEIQIDGVDVTNHVDWEEFNVHQGSSDDASVLSLRLVGTPSVIPLWGQSVEVWIGGVGGGYQLFGGTITNARLSFRRPADSPHYQIEALDYRYLMNRTALVTAKYEQRGLSYIIGDILATFTDSASGFRVGFVPNSIVSDPISVEFESTPVSEAITRLCSDLGLIWVIEGKIVSAFNPIAVDGQITVNRPFGASLYPLASAASTGGYRDIEVEYNVLELTNKLEVSGTTTRLTAAVNAGDTTISVQNAGIFTTGGGYLRIGNSDILEIPVQDLADGAGDVSLTDAVTEFAEEGTTVTHMAVVEDAANQAVAAARFGSSQDGVIVGADGSQVNGDALSTVAANKLTVRTIPRERVSLEVFERPSVVSYQVTNALFLGLVPGNILDPAQLTTDQSSLSFTTNLPIRSVDVYFAGRRPENGNVVFARRIVCEHIVMPLSGMLLEATFHNRETAHSHPQE